MKKQNFIHYSLPLLLVSFAISLSACGFHLRGSMPHQTSIKGLAADNVTYQLALPEDTHQAKQAFEQYLSAAGLKLTQAKDSPIIRIIEVIPRRQALSGPLTEVTLRLTIRFQVENSHGVPISDPRSIQVNRNYQYEIATVNTENQEQDYLWRQLYAEAAEKIGWLIYNQHLVPADESLYDNASRPR